MGAINPRHQAIVRTRLDNPWMTLKEIGDKFHVSGELARQVLNKAGVRTAAKPKPKIGTPKPCFYCGDPTPTKSNKFCSPECRHEERHTEFMCTWCGTEFMRNWKQYTHHLKDPRYKGMTFCSKRCQGKYLGHSVGFGTRPHHRADLKWVIYSMSIGEAKTITNDNGTILVSRIS